MKYGPEEEMKEARELTVHFHLGKQGKETTRKVELGVKGRNKLCIYKYLYPDHGNLYSKKFQLDGFP